MDSLHKGPAIRSFGSSLLLALLVCWAIGLLGVWDDVFCLFKSSKNIITSWTLSASLALCERNPSVSDGFHSQRPSNTELWFFISVSLNMLLSQQSSYQWFETPWRSCDVTVISVWRHYNESNSPGSKTQGPSPTCGWVESTANKRHIGLIIYCQTSNINRTLVGRQ